MVSRIVDREGTGPESTALYYILELYWDSNVWVTRPSFWFNLTKSFDLCTNFNNYLRTAERSKRKLSPCFGCQQWREVYRCNFCVQFNLYTSPYHNVKIFRGWPSGNKRLILAFVSTGSCVIHSCISYVITFRQIDNPVSIDVILVWIMWLESWKQVWNLITKSLFLSLNWLCDWIYYNWNFLVLNLTLKKLVTKS